MIRVRFLTRLAALLLLAGAGLLFAARAHGEDGIALKGHVADETITLTDGAGKGVTHLDPGTYTIEVVDEAPFCNFHLRGPGVDKATDPTKDETVTWTVTFTDGTYTFFCDARARGSAPLEGRFTVGHPPPTTTTKQAPPPAANTLVATVGPGFTITLKRRNGKVLKSTKRGRYRLIVRDRASTHNFDLVGPGRELTYVNTSVPFVGTRTWTLTLKPGSYRFMCDPHAPTMYGTFNVTR